MSIKAADYLDIEPKQVDQPITNLTTFTIKGYRIAIPIRVRKQNGFLVPGPSDLLINLKENGVPNGYDRSIRTDKKGVAHFYEVPLSIFKVRLEQEELIFGLKNSMSEVMFEAGVGFKMADTFIIETSLVEGYVKPV